MGTVIDLITRLPIEIWFQENPKASDTKLEEQILQLVTAKTLLFAEENMKKQLPQPKGKTHLDSQ